MEEVPENDSRDRAYLGGGSRIGHWSNRRFHATLMAPAPATVENAYVAHVLEIRDGDRKVFSASWDHPHILRSQVFLQGEWQAEFLAVR